MIPVKRLFVLLFLLMLGSGLQGQYRIDDGTELLALQKVPMEKIYVHLSSNLLFSGEYLYYKLYCMDARSGRLNPASSLAYLRLVNEKGDTIFTHKLKLEGGMAVGDFFVTTDIPSGNYKLIAYTRWMQNGGLRQLFRQDIAILNPYQSDQTVFLKQESEAGAGSPDRLPDMATDAGSPGGMEQEDNSSRGLIELQPDAAVYSERDAVTLSVRNFKGPLGHGSYSLLVRRLPEWTEPRGLSAAAFGRKYGSAQQVLPQGIGDSIYLPEQRGELIFGQVLDRETGLPAPDREVIISIPGEYYVLTSAATNTDGYFFSYLRKPYLEDQIFYQVTDEGSYSIEVGSPRPMPLDSLEMGAFRIGTEDRDYILSRSVDNQLENAYFERKPDTLVPREIPDPFVGGIPEVIELDDYTRFPTFQETLVEILNFVGYRNAPGDKDYLRVAQDFETYNEPYNNDPALLLIDGVFIPKPGDYKGFNARSIKTIKVLRDPLVMGSKTYQGIVSVETFDRDFPGGYRFENGYAGPLDLPQRPKRYFQPDHSLSEYRRIPDFRQILFWEPMLDISSPEQTLTFFTSDLPGTYEIRLEGFTSYGKPISVRSTFKVRSKP